ncbi:MAG: Nramp family divalent metal transporter [Gemmataceae bacterium]
MKRIWEIALGIVASVGSWLEIGSISTTISGGAEFGYQLLWVAALSGIMLIVLTEMAGRYTAVSGETVSAGLRRRFGFNWFLIPVLVIVAELVFALAAEVGGIAVALEMATGVNFRIWAIPAAALTWLVLMSARFPTIEKAISVIGLLSLVFVVAAVMLRPDMKEVAAGLIPRQPESNGTRYWFLAVAIVGASISPYMLFFYSDGAKEDEWSTKDLPINYFVAWVGMGFGTLMSIAALIAAVQVFPRGHQINDYRELAEVLTQPFGERAGLWSFVAALFAACLSAAIMLTMVIGYLLAEEFRWRRSPGTNPAWRGRFTLVYTIALLIGGVLMSFGLDPLKLTLWAMAATSLTLPAGVYPFLVLMHDTKRLGPQHINGRFSTGFVAVSLGISCIIVVVTIPLTILAGN